MDVVKRAEFLVSGVFPEEDRGEREWSRTEPKALIRVPFNAHHRDGLCVGGPQSICINGHTKHTDKSAVLSYRK